MHLFHVLLDNIVISLSSRGAFPVLCPAWLWDEAQALLQHSTDNKGGILCWNAAPEQSRGTCAKVSHILKLDTCSLSNLVWPKQLNPREEGSPQLLLSEKSVSCVRVSQCLIMPWSFSATWAMKDTNLYLLLDLKQATQPILSLAALPCWASSLALELMCFGMGQKDGFYGCCLSINSFSLGDFYFHCPSIYAMQGIM